MDRIWEARGDDQSNIPKKVRSTEACTSSLEWREWECAGQGGGGWRTPTVGPDQARQGKSVEAGKLGRFPLAAWDGLAPSTARPHASRGAVGNGGRPEGFQAASAVQLVAREVPRTTLASRRQRQGPVWSWSWGAGARRGTPGEI